MKGVSGEPSLLRSLIEIGLPLASEWKIALSVVLPRPFSAYMSAYCNNGEAAGLDVD